MTFRKRCLFWLLLVLSASTATQAAITVAEASITVSVVDEQLEPVQNAQVWIAFEVPRSPDDLWEGLDSEEIEGVTDVNGAFTATGQTMGSLQLLVSHDGYYESSTAYEFSEAVDGKWVPHNPIVQVALEKRDNPRPLYARKLHDVEVPVLDAPVGYDLFVGDWVSPHGEGVESDLVFTLVRDYKSRFDFTATLTIATSGQHDGFAPIHEQQGAVALSELQSPKTAPATGYDMTSIVVSTSQSDTQPASMENQTFFFRIRTKVDEQDQLAEALYGKLIGPIECELHETATGKISLTYYLNPDPNDRNLEFDIENNLFTNLNWFEQVTRP